MAVSDKYDYDQPPVDTTTSFDPNQLAGSTAVVTGGASGLGRAYCENLAAVGVSVVIVDLNEELGEQVVAGIEKKGGRAIFAKADMTSWTEQLSAFKAALDFSPTKRIQHVISNAGIMPPDDMAVLDDKDGDPKEPNLITVRVNYIGALYTAKLALHYMQRNPPEEDRSLIIKSSLAGYLDIIGFPQYNSSKYGSRGLMCTLRSIAPKTGVRVNLIAPWTIRTPIMATEALDHLEKITKLAKIEDAIQCVLFVSCSRKMNGRAFAVLPREFEKNGFVDIATDDQQDSPLLKKLLKEVTSIF